MTKWNLETLPLLATFQALLDHGGVTEAADALGLTQSAVSKHLSKLRDAYGDPLFVRTAKGMRPTPRATWMSAHVATILTEAETLSEARLFQPKLLTGILSISTTDEVCEALLASLLPRLNKEAPDLRLTFAPLSPDYSLSDLEAGRLDLVISVNWHAPEILKQSRLFEDRFVCLMSNEHDLAQVDLTIEEYAARDHMMVAPLGMREGRIDEFLARHDLRRTIRVSVPQFLHITPDLLGSRYLLTLPSRVADRLCKRHPNQLVMRDLPFVPLQITYFALWHTRFDRDPRHIWLRNMIRQALAPNGIAAPALTRQ